jgi:hypothetical protein
MKTIEIQKNAILKNNWISVIVNGKKHTMRQQSLMVQVADGNPFEVKVAYNLFAGSIKYQFEPKDGMVLQVFSNPKKTKKFLAFISVGLILSWVFPFVDNEFFYSIIACCVLLMYLIFFIFIRKKFFEIKEFDIENTVSPWTI